MIGKSYFNKLRHSRQRRKRDAEELERQRRRILFVERHIIWPIKLMVVVLSYLLWQRLVKMEGAISAGVPSEEVEWAITVFGYELILYLVANLVFAVPLMLVFQVYFGPGVIRWCAFLSAVVDNLFLSALIHITGVVNPETGGFNSVLYWIYCGVMVRNALYFPVIYQQALINLSVIGSYTLALFLAEGNIQFIRTELFVLRISVLVLVGICCWGIEILGQRQQRRAEAQQEHLLRSEKIRATGHLAAEVAHQLKNPLAIINNAAFNLQRNLERGKQVTPEAVEIIRQEVQRADRILTDLMNFSGLTEVKIESVDVNETLESALATRLAPAAASGITVRKDLDEDLPPLFAQRRWLEECFLNLISNAVEAMPNGGKLTVRSRAEPLGWITVEVEDTGPGVPPEQRDRIFEPFFTTKKGGTGLGLSIVKNIVEMYSGRVSVAAANGGGARFIVELPLHTKQVR